MRSDEAALYDIATAARRAREFLGAMPLEGFLADEKTQSAVLHQLLVLGEAVKRLSAGFRDAHDEVPWSKVAGMRDVLIHADDSVDVEEVHRTVMKDVPALEEALRRLGPGREDA